MTNQRAARPRAAAGTQSFGERRRRPADELRCRRADRPRPPSVGHVAARRQRSRRVALRDTLSRTTTAAGRTVELGRQ